MTRITRAIKLGENLLLPLYLATYQHYILSGWWLVAGVDLLREKNMVGLLVVGADLM